MKTVRQKKCKACSEKFTPTRPLQVACSPKCAIEVSQNVKARKEARDLLEAKRKLKTRADWMREAQAIFNKFIRLRDKEEPCISCGRWHQGQWHAGHYLTTKARPELRLDERNVNKQCSVCNNHLSGNIATYRIGLIAKYGQEVVEWLEGPHDLKRWSVDELKQIIATYKQKIKEVENKNIDVF